VATDFGTGMRRSLLNLVSHPYLGGYFLQQPKQLFSFNQSFSESKIIKFKKIIKLRTIQFLNLNEYMNILSLTHYGNLHIFDPLKTIPITPLGVISNTRN